MTEPDANKKNCESRDLLLGKKMVLLVWGLPIAMIFAASLAQGLGWISLTFAGAFWTAAPAWIGIGCLINGRICGRVHCIVAGWSLPILSLFGVANILGVLSFSWSTIGIYWVSLYSIIITAFLFEVLWKRYY